MARTFGKIFASQWDDEDFTSLGADAKYVYNFLIPQHDLGHSGIIALRIAPWARRLSKTVAEVNAALRELHARKYVVIDDEEMLLLVRSLIRNDDVYKQPNVFKAAAAQIYACPSKPIRRALLAELERLDEAGMRGDTREVCSELIAWLRKGSGNPSPDPSGKGSGDEIRQSGQSGQLAHESAGEEGSSNPSGNPLPRAHACAGVPLPLPLPVAPSVNPSAADAAGAEPAALFDSPAAVDSAPTAPANGNPDAGSQQNAAALVAEWIESRPNNRPPGRTIGHAGKELRILLEEDRIPYEVVRTGFMAWSRKGSAPSAIASFVNEAQARAANVVVPFQRSVPNDLGGDEHMARFLARQGLDPTRRTS
ncbi:hypothetical protein [Actinocrinis sp.]|uniref:hypothetical protein n=1 Tax=Actinocrinis sp. TaxID=1920516 RepID=UPI002D3A6287|nr:hypothetical protein [Actinocrinis sp.]HZP54986.1 hypothetical protein [Actinocrinis sp.]